MLQPWSKKRERAPVYESGKGLKKSGKRGRAPVCGAVTEHINPLLCLKPPSFLPQRILALLLSRFFSCPSSSIPSQVPQLPFHLSYPCHPKTSLNRQITFHSTDSTDIAILTKFHNFDKLSIQMIQTEQTIQTVQWRQLRLTDKKRLTFTEAFLCPVYHHIMYWVKTWERQRAKKSVSVGIVAGNKTET